MPIRETAGMICGEFVMCYPPGIPILAPGEMITREIIDYIIYAKEKGCSMQGHAGSGSGDRLSCQHDQENIWKVRRREKQMELWFSDYHTEKVKVSVKVQKQLFGLQTEFQRIDVFDSDEFGRFFKF